MQGQCQVGLLLVLRSSLSRPRVWVSGWYVVLASCDDCLMGVETELGRVLFLYAAAIVVRSVVTCFWHPMPRFGSDAGSGAGAVPLVA